VLSSHILICLQTAFNIANPQGTAVTIFIANISRLPAISRFLFLDVSAHSLTLLLSPLSPLSLCFVQPLAECRMRLRHASRLDSGTNKAPANRFNLGYCAEISWDQVFGAPVWANLTFHFSQLMLLARFV